MLHFAAGGEAAVFLFSPDAELMKFSHWLNYQHKVEQIWTESGSCQLSAVLEVCDSQGLKDRAGFYSNIAHKETTNHHIHQPGTISSNLMTWHTSHDFC